MTIKRCYSVLVGASVVENQLCNGESVTVPNGRKYYLKKSRVESLGASTGTAITGLTSGSDMVIDLTQKLGPAIADYAYSLEQTTAGSGIAWLRSYGFITDDYKSYNAGTLESVEVTEKKVVGFNQWDEEWENGFINDNGQNSTLNTAMRSKNYIAVIPGSTYYIHCPRTAFVFHYDANKTFIGKDSTHGSGGNLRDEIFAIPQSTHYVRFCLYDTPTYNHDICINISSSRNGEYEPYKSIAYPLGTDTLHGIFKLDANNKLYADGDRKEADGTITRKYGIVDLGTLTWYKNATYSGLFNADILGRKIENDIPFVCSQYARTDSTTVITLDKSLAFSNGSNAIYVHDDSFTDVTTFKSAMSGVMLVYELATPTTEQSTPFTSPQLVYPDGTEEFVTENGVPVGHETKYQL